MQFGIVVIHVNRRAGGLFELLRAPDMVDMRVGDHNRFHRQSVARNHGQYPRDVVAGIHYDRLAALFIAENRTIALQHSYREHLVDHMPIVYSRLWLT